MGRYRIEYSESVKKKDIPAFPTTMRLRVRNAIEERLQVNPTKLGKPLSYKFKGYFRLRVGNYRIIYQVDPLEHKVIIDTIKHRDKVCE